MESIMYGASVFANPEMSLRRENEERSIDDSHVEELEALPILDAIDALNIKLD